MDMVTWQVASLWAAVALYAVSTVLFVAAAVFRRNGRWEGSALALATAGLLPHGIALLLRWAEVGHGPYISFYEVASSDTWVAVATFAFVARRYPRLRLAGMAVLPVSFLLIGAAVFAPHEGRELLPILRSYWLVLHVTFAKLAYGPYLLGMGAAILYLWTLRAPQPPPGKAAGTQLRASLAGRGSTLPSHAGKWTGGLDPRTRLSDPAVLDELSYRLVAFGFLMHAVMIFAGAIWANQAWGSYWSWDPIETWSLVSWICFAVVLHLRIIHGWRGTRAALGTVGAVIVVIFAFFAIPFLGGSHQILLGF